MHPEDWPLSHGLDSETRDHILERCHRRTYDRGQEVVGEGDPGHSLYLITAGRLEILGRDLDGHVLIFTLMKAGEMAGEGALLSPDEVRTATMQAFEPTTLSVLGRADFDDIRKRRPSFDRYLTNVLAGQVRRLSAQLVQAMHTDGLERAFHRLAWLCEHFEIDADGDEIPLSQEKLAQLTGVGRGLANETLGQLREAGLIDTKYGKIVVLDAVGLRERLRF